jgi:CII-binding regulator of phage lambda lysogenization HflD
MIDAEREARAGQGHKANQLSSLENTFMNSLKSEISAESVNNTTRLQSTLDRLIAELLTLDTKTEAQKQAFDELRNRALGTRSQLIVQREATGFTKDNNNVVESMFPIPRRSN